MAQALAKRGHKIYFLMNEDYKGKLTEYGFEEIMLEKPTLPPPPAPPGSEAKEGEGPAGPPNPLKEFAQMLLNTGVLGSTKSPIEKVQQS